MNVLLTNDDGIFAPGLWALYNRFVKRHDVFVIAPDRERSAVSHGITLHEPIRATLTTVNGGLQGYAVSGTPADCVKLGVLELMDNPPDIVVAGINAGANVGININYSGTVAAAKEAAIYGIAAIAVSSNGCSSRYYGEVAGFIEELAHKVFNNGLPPGTFLNVNVPESPFGDTAGVCVSRQGLDLYTEHFEKRTDPRNRTYYWQGCESPTINDDANVDNSALQKHYIAITPIKCDMTDYEALERLKKWRLDRE
jgi:5'-nucleotidase